MAKLKNRPRDTEAALLDEAGDFVEEAAGPSEEEQAAPARARRWRVSLNATTPLAHRELVVEADTEAQAREAFCAANGISDSTCEWRVERVD